MNYDFTITRMHCTGNEYCSFNDAVKLLFLLLASVGHLVIHDSTIISSAVACLKELSASLLFTI